MPELTISVRVPWPKHPTLATLEKAICRALMAAGRELLLLACATLEGAVLAEGAGARQRRRRRYLLTRFGELRFYRWQTVRDGRYGHPLDEALGLPAKDPCSPWVRATAAWLAQAHPFRQAARLLSMMVGARVDHRRVWGWAQTSGRRVLQAWEEKRAPCSARASSLLPPGRPMRSSPPEPTGRSSTPGTDPSRSSSGCGGPGRVW